MHTRNEMLTSEILVYAREVCPVGGAPTSVCSSWSYGKSACMVKNTYV